MPTKICILCTDDTPVMAVCLPKNQPNWKDTVFVAALLKKHQESLNKAWATLHPDIKKCRDQSINIIASVSVVDLLDENGNQISCLSPVKTETGSLLPLLSPDERGG